MAEQQVFEFRGVDNLYYARVLQDDDAGFLCDTPKRLSPVAEVAKSTDSSNEAHYYDNKPLIVVASESADTITITSMTITMATITATVLMYPSLHL